jgi:hypothetical protein
MLAPPITVRLKPDTTDVTSGCWPLIGATLEQPRQVRAAVMRPSVVAIGLGLAAGLTATLGAGRWLTSLLYGVTPTDPATLAIVRSILSATGLAAATLAAARVLRTDPAPVLRAEGPARPHFPLPPKVRPLESAGLLHIHALTCRCASRSV